MEIRPIHSEAGDKATLREVSVYFDSDPEPGSADGDRFEVLLTLVEAYEAKHFPIDLPDPLDAINQVPNGARRADAEGPGARHRPPEPGSTKFSLASVP